MPKVTNIPEALRVHRFHGVNIDPPNHGNECLGECPFCGKDNKYSVNLDTALWRCLSCNIGTSATSESIQGGNDYTFIRVLYEHGNTPNEELRIHRKLLRLDTLIDWGVILSPITGEPLIPAHNTQGEICQLYKYTNMGTLTPAGTTKMALWATPGMHHQLFGMGLFDHHKPKIILCEGPWDAMALYETMKIAQEISEESFLHDTNILAIPGCNTFVQVWCPLFAGKDVTLMFDNDHPRTQGDRVIPSAGYEGMRRVSQILQGADIQPKSISYLSWDPHQGSHNPDLPSGYDVRDALTHGRAVTTPLLRVMAVKQLLGKVKPVPEQWVKDIQAGTNKTGNINVEPIPCKDWKILINAWKKALKWTDGLDKGLSCMLACAVSTKAVGDQLWLKLISPPSSGKSVLCEAMSVSHKYVKALSTFRGFHSGYKSDRTGAEDNSLIPQIRDKTLIIKDGDTLLQAPNLSQILAEARDIYDSVSRNHYRNKIARDYQGIRMTFILCGTESLRRLDSSELGERFLDCVMIQEMPDDLEDEIGWRVANRASREMAYEADGKPETREGPEMIKAKQLTGGYVIYLRENAQKLLSSVKMPDWAKQQCMKLAKFVAFMRARPSITQEESAQRELSFRVISQLVRLAQCLAVVRNEKEVTEDIMNLVSSVALDTARGRTFQIIKTLYQAEEQGMEARAIAIVTNQNEDREKLFLRFLRQIKAVELFAAQIAPGIRTKPRWKLTPTLRDLYYDLVASKEPVEYQDDNEEGNSEGNSEGEYQ